MISPEIERAIQQIVSSKYFANKRLAEQHKRKEVEESKEQTFLGRSRRRSYWTGTRALALANYFRCPGVANVRAPNCLLKLCLKITFLRSHFTIFAKKLSYDYVSIEICAYI